MEKKKPRRRKAPAAETPRVPNPEPPAPVEVVVHRASPSQPVPLVFQLVETLRLVAERMIDIADATAEALKRRLEGRA